MYFNSIGDLLTTMMKINVIPMGSSMIAAILGFITGYVYHDGYTVAAIVCSFSFDLASGIWASYIKKIDDDNLEYGLKTFILAIQSRKLLRSFISLTFHLALLSLAWHSSNIQPVFNWFPGLLVGGIIGTQVVSILENLYKGKVIKAALFELVIDRLDLSKLLKKKKDDQTRP